MTADPPDLAHVLRAIVPPPRQPGDDPDPTCCEQCRDEAARLQAIRDWRVLNEAIRWADAERGGR